MVNTLDRRLFVVEEVGLGDGMQPVKLWYAQRKPEHGSGLWCSFGMCGEAVLKVGGGGCFD